VVDNGAMVSEWICVACDRGYGEALLVKATLSVHSQLYLACRS
jgi:hypothetical protein